MAINNSSNIGVTGVVQSNGDGTFTGLSAGTGISLAGNQISSTVTGSNVIFTRFTADGTWTKNANTKWVKVVLWNGGSGGGSGRRGAAGSNRCGGGGGAPGSVLIWEADEAYFSATESVVIGQGGAGGPAITVDDTSGTAGTQGTDSSFGILTCLNESLMGGAAGGTSTSALGGSTTVIYGILAATNGPTGGAGRTLAGLNGSSYPGQSTGVLTGGGGGGGGGITNLDAVNNGGDGSDLLQFSRVFTGSVIINGALGGVAGGLVNGINGANFTSIGTPTNIFFGGGGGGGGAGNDSGAAGNGGNGGIPGGGGGGGGGSLNGNNSGAGGTGGRGEVWVYEFT